uniref:Phosphatidylinositol-glycan biosynthesis class W protein n=1 Tax=Panagrolaimus sp. ES5 TaxID=591445 RepID=A0AC34FAI8_9BILA
MFIGTAVAILAFDFDVFPERFGKTVNYGMSVMDIGTAMFVISMALSEYIITHRPQKSAKLNRSKQTPSYLSTFVILLGIGFVKELFAHIFKYSHSTIEYGEHWNFFITLGFLKLFTTIFPYPYSIPVGIIIGLTYQTALNLGLESWILRDDRDSWNVIDANREGICSLFGYIFVYGFTLIIIKFVAIVDGIFNPSYKSVSFWMIAGAFTYFGQLLMMEIFGEPSRRIANIPYVLAMVSMKCAVIGFLQLIQIQGVLRSNTKSETFNAKGLNLLESISGNCLLFFLIANLATGFVNSVIHTHSVQNVALQMTILIAYNFGICLFIYVWHLFNNRKLPSKGNPSLEVIIEK